MALIVIILWLLSASHSRCPIIQDQNNKQIFYKYYYNIINIQYSTYIVITISDFDIWYTSIYFEWFWVDSMNVKVAVAFSMIDFWIYRYR